MKTDIETLKDSSKVGYDAYEESIEEANEVENMYHNRQYTEDQLATLSNRGQPAETFKVVKLLARLLIGYYSPVLNSIKAVPTKQSSISSAGLLNDVIEYITRFKAFNT